MTTEDEFTSVPSRLAEAATLAGYAPSIHNTQPWRWRVDGDALELYAEPTRQLPTSDPGGRLMVLSCGAALHHARTALAAQGCAVEIARLPESEQARLLARLTVSGRTEVSPDAMRLVQTIRIRHTDRRPVSETTLEPAAIDAIRAAVEAEHSWLHTLRPDDVFELATAADRAQTIEEFDPRWREEISYWAGGTRRDGLGVPDAVIPHEAPQTTVPGRNFGITGDLPVSAGHDHAAVYGVLFGLDDTPGSWLRAGEALSAGWLAAIEHGVSVLPLSAAVEVDSTRLILRRLLSGLGEPFLVLRFGVADPEQSGPPHTPRLPSTQVIEVVGEASAPA
jgi:nitroreductase